jgi:hypothetical protein
MELHLLFFDSVTADLLVGRQRHICGHCSKGEQLGVL